MADVSNFYRTIKCESEVTVLKTWTTVCFMDNDELMT
jgi:hypothetical protein